MSMHLQCLAPNDTKILFRSLEKFRTFLEKSSSFKNIKTPNFWKTVYVYLDLPWTVTFDQFEVFAEVAAATEAYFDDLHRAAISNRTQVRAFDAPIPVLCGYLPGKGACITRHVQVTSSKISTHHYTVISSGCKNRVCS